MMKIIHWEVWNFMKGIKSIEKFYDKKLKVLKSCTIVKDLTLLQATSRKHGN